MSDVALAGEILRRDVYPAEVLLPGGELLTGVRAFITSQRVLVYAAAGRDVELVRELPLARDSVPGDRNTLRQGAGSLQLDLVDGTGWVNAGRGCGCGTPVKGMRVPVSWTGR